MSASALDAQARPTGVYSGSSRVGKGPGLRRFVWAVIVGSIVAAVPYSWFLMDEWWGTLHPFRLVNPDDFYDLQAEAILHGHLWVPKASLSIEGFIHDGRTYTYFGLLPSLLRIPVLAIAPKTIGRLTAPSMLLAWVLTALLIGLLIWRVRIMLRGSVPMGRAEAVSIGVLVASVLGGSILLFIAAAPWVYNEDMAWMVVVTLATLFALLGVLERPSRRRVTLAGVLMIAGALARPTASLACVVGAALMAAWFFRGRSTTEQRRWALPMLAVALVPFALTCAINWLKFGTTINGLPLADQVWTHIDAHRRAFLAATGGEGYSFHFLPSMLLAYLQPFALRIQSTFPFLSLPVYPPRVVGGYLVDIFYPTPSITATMPLLCLLSLWAVIISFRPHASRGAMLMRIPLIIGVLATAVDFVLGYIATRYLADFLPFLVLGSAVGIVELSRHWEGRRRSVRRIGVGAVVVLAIFGLVANAGIALTPTTEWLPSQSANYVRAVKAVSDITGDPLAKQIERGTSMPYWAPAGDLFIAGNCQGLYLSSGEPVNIAPWLQEEHRTWVPVEQGEGINTTFKLTFNGPVARLGSGVPILKMGGDTISVRSAGQGKMRFVLGDPRHPAQGQRIRPKLGHTYTLKVESDPFLDYLVVRLGMFNIVLNGTLSAAKPGEAMTVAYPAGQSHGTLLTEKAEPSSPNMSLCRSLQSEH